MSLPAKYLTHFERSGFLESPDYASTLAYFKQFEETGKAEMFTFGVSPQGRELKFLTVGKDGDCTPAQARANGKLVVLVQNGIHAGEIEGKDACMLLLREILITGKLAHLLEHLVLVIIPILNVDGHERTSPFNRPNQNGPARMGWRTTSWNLNLNRDYMKADTPEMRSLLQLYTSWQPDFYIDNHTTNGADYQYHITYGIETHRNIDAGIAQFAKNKLMPFVVARTERAGFLTAPYTEWYGETITEGVTDWPQLPRYSGGYAAVQNRLLLLVETHARKPFANRVHSTKTMNEATLEYLNTNYRELRELNYFADVQTVHSYRHERTPFPLVLEGSAQHHTMHFKGYKAVDANSPITGAPIVQYSNLPEEIEIPFYSKDEIVTTVDVPFAYAVPPEFAHLVEIMRLHGIEARQIREAESVEVEQYRFTEARFAPTPYEGRQQVECGVERFTERVTLPPGTHLIYTQQRTLRVILHLLEPQAPDSFVRWGFFNAFFERKEYIEEYIMEPIARTMLDDIPALREDFHRRLHHDEGFAGNRKLRLDFFYERSPYFDRHERVYPILRLPHID